MVVRVGATTGRHARRDYWSLLCATVLLAGIIVVPAPTRAAGSSPPGSPNPASPFAFGGSAAGSLRQTQVFDPAAALSSMMSFGAMSVIAMPQTMGLDPATSTMLDGGLQGLLPGGGSADEFGVDSGGAGAASSGVVDGLSGGVPTIGEAGVLPTIGTAQGIQPLWSSDNPMAQQLQVGGKFWDAQGDSAAPVPFPPGVFTGLDVKNHLGVDPSGPPSNLSPPGQESAGSFSEKGPLESRYLWIAVVTLLVVVVVFWLSRGGMMTRTRP